MEKLQNYEEIISSKTDSPSEIMNVLRDELGRICGILALVLSMGLATGCNKDMNEKIKQNSIAVCRAKIAEQISNGIKLDPFCHELLSKEGDVIPVQPTPKETDVFMPTTTEE